MAHAGGAERGTRPTAGPHARPPRRITNPGADALGGPSLEVARSIGVTLAKDDYEDAARRREAIRLRGEDECAAATLGADATAARAIMAG